MKINVKEVRDDLGGFWWHHIHSANFGFEGTIKDLGKHEVSVGDVLVHKEKKEGEQFPSVRYHLVLEKGTKVVENEEIKEALAQNLVNFVRKNKKLPYACKFVKTFKNGNAQVDYHPSQFDNFALKVIPKAHGIENAEAFLKDLETSENPLKPKGAAKSGTRQWEMESSKDPTKKYKVTRYEDGKWTCTCPHFSYRRTECKHIKECKNKL